MGRRSFKLELLLFCFFKVVFCFHQITNLSRRKTSVLTHVIRCTFISIYLESSWNWCGNLNPFSRKRYGKGIRRWFPSQWWDPRRGSYGGENKTKWPELVWLNWEERRDQAYISSSLCRKENSWSEHGVKVALKGGFWEYRNRKRDCGKPQKWASSSFQRGRVGDFFSCSLCLHWNS